MPTGDHGEPGEATRTEGDVSPLAATPDSVHSKTTAPPVVEARTAVLLGATGVCGPPASAPHALDTKYRGLHSQIAGSRGSQPVEE